MGKTARVEKNCDFRQMGLPLNLGEGEKVLRHTRLIAESVKGAWYELYLIDIPHGYLIEKHSGISSGQGRQKETWFRRELNEAERKYSQILRDKLNPLRKSPRKYKVIESMAAAATVHSQ